MKQMLFDWIDMEIGEEAVILRSAKPLKIMSSAPINGGLTESRTIVNLLVDLDFSADPAEHFRSKYRSLGVPQDSVCLMTAATVSKAVVSGGKKDGIGFSAVVTAGTSNSSSISDGIKDGRMGTINAIIVADRAMSLGCMVNAIMSASEAKCKALSSLDLRSKYSDELATGTSSDAVLVACPIGEEELLYAGSATPLGFLIGANVESAVRRAVIAHDDLAPERPLEKRLAERGILVEDLVEAAMELYMPHPSIKDGDAREAFLRCLRSAMEDANVGALVMGAIRLNEDGVRGLIPGMNKELFDSDPVHLVADEVIGISIATHIAGYYGVFEFYRFDRKKPGILARLPPFVDDAIGALIGGASSRMYTELFKGSR